jgi:hypothetical protein
MTIPIIFAHYGLSDYLHRTLKCASLTNPAANRYFIGDESNMTLAENFGWRAINGAQLKSSLRAEFVDHFQPIYGPNFEVGKNGGDWLRYVSERWFMVEALAKSESIDRFWFFDTDTMILENLSSFAGQLQERGVSHTKQCNNYGLSGYVTAGVATAFCEFMVSIFRDEDKRGQLDWWRNRIATVEPEAAFTEMASFDWFEKDRKIFGPHLEAQFDGWWFDDVICQDDGFETARMNFVGRPIKRVEFDGQRFYGRRGDKEVRFATLNCSWVPMTVFDFLLRCVEQRSEGKPLRQSLANKWFGVQHFVKASGYRVLKRAGII